MVNINIEIDVCNSIMGFIFSMDTIIAQLLIIKSFFNNLLIKN